MNEDFTTLESTYGTLWKWIEAAPGDSSSPARTPVLATAGLDGGASARMVVLRAASEAKARLTVYTHAQSDKVAELAARPEAAFLFWDAVNRFQVRVRARIAAGPGPRDVWDAMADHERLLYATYPDPADSLTPAEPHPDNFCRLTAQVTEIETLHLGRDRHRRARFLGPYGRKGTWIGPNP